MLLALEQGHLVPAAGEYLRSLHAGRAATDDEPASRFIRRPQRPLAETLFTAVRLFRGVGGTVTYLGEFRVDVKRPWYRMDAPETGRGPTRQVIVFRLRPVGEVVRDPQDELDLPRPIDPADVAVVVRAEEGSPRVSEVPVEAQHSEEAVVNPSSAEYVANRREQTLVLAYKAYLERLGSNVIRFRIHPPGEAKPLLSDLYDATRRNLIEAKGTGTREAIRMAIGQLADYGRFTDAGTAFGVLLAERPRADLEALLTSQVSCVWRTETGFVDNAAGRFT